MGLLVRKEWEGGRALQRLLSFGPPLLPSSHPLPLSLFPPAERIKRSYLHTPSLPSPLPLHKHLPPTYCSTFSAIVVYLAQRPIPHICIKAVFKFPNSISERIESPKQHLSLWHPCTECTHLPDLRFHQRTEDSLPCRTMTVHRKGRELRHNLSILHFLGTVGGSRPCLPSFFHPCYLARFGPATVAP